MKANRIVLKLGSTIILLFLVVLLPLGFVINQIFQGFYYNQVQSMYQVKQLLILSGVGAFFLALGFTFVLSRKLSDPLIQMERAARKIAKGELETRVSIVSSDEVGSLAKAFNEMAEDLQKYRDSRREFFANISHELRTPMTYLQGYAKVVKEKLYTTEEEKDKYLEIIQQEANRLTHLIEDLFDLSKMEEGKVSLQLEWIDLSELIGNVVQKIKPQAMKKHLFVHMDISECTALVCLDGNRMEQVFMNLFDNAIRYTDNGVIRVSLQQESNLIIAIVEDTGIGIPEDELPYIFDRFYRVEKSRSREHGGTGLGLAIVKQLVELQGGTVMASSVTGKGTHIRITLPIGGIAP